MSRHRHCVLIALFIAHNLVNCEDHETTTTKPARNLTTIDLRALNASTLLDMGLPTESYLDFAETDADYESAGSDNSDSNDGESNEDSARDFATPRDASEFMEYFDELVKVSSSAQLHVPVLIELSCSDVQRQARERIRAVHAARVRTQF